MTADYYRDEICEGQMLPHAREKLAEDFIFQQDGDSKHTAIIMRGGYDRKLKKQIPGWFAENEVEVMQWPSQSPDLNPIEHLWAEVERKLGARSFKRPQELWEAIQKVWSEIPMDSLINLVDSMPRRCQAVLNAKGYATKY
jgi:hypothetical protein